MPNPIPYVFAGLLLVSGSALSAQETGAEAPADDAAADLSLGTAVVGEPQIGQPFIREVSGDWAIRCIKSEEGNPDPCQLYQLLSDAEGNAVAEISMFPLPAGNRAEAGATIVVPLETLLTEQITITVDGANGRRYPFTFCNAAGCVSRVGFTSEEVAQFKRGNSANLRLVPAAAPDQEVNLTISLTGFTAGFTQSGQPAE